MLACESDDTCLFFPLQIAHYSILFFKGGRAELPMLPVTLFVFRLHI